MKINVGLNWSVTLKIFSDFIMGKNTSNPIFVHIIFNILSLNARKCMEFLMPLVDKPS